MDMHIHPTHRFFKLSFIGQFSSFVVARSVRNPFSPLESFSPTPVIDLFRLEANVHTTIDSKLGLIVAHVNNTTKRGRPSYSIEVVTEEPAATFQTMINRLKVPYMFELKVSVYCFLLHYILVTSPYCP